MASTPFQPQESGFFIYPAQGWRKLMFKWPLQLWRMGFGPILGQVMMVVTQTGRKSGLPRHTMLEYYRLRERPYVLSGWGTKSQWAKNLLANPHCTIQTAHGAEGATAVHVQNDAELWEIYHLFMQHDPVLTRRFLALYGIAESPDEFVACKDRYYAFRFDTAGEPPLPPLTTDLLWVWPVTAVALILLWLLKRQL
jgi:deazaflavin-dependent oxidoreductase (nitroreductase family)